MASSFAISCLAASASERRCSAAPFDSAAAASCLAAKSAASVAAASSVGVKSVETYKARAAEKLELKTRADIVRYAAAQGWLADI
jgi:DNA-binding NarL/FixJ family response regulator